MPRRYVALNKVFPNRGHSVVPGMDTTHPYPRTMNDDLYDDDLETQWTPAARARFVTAGRSLLESIEKQIRLLQNADARTDDESVNSSSSGVEAAAIEYADAYFDFSGHWHPFGFLESIEKDDEGDDENEKPERGDVVSVLLRADFRVADEEIVLTGGRRSYQEHSGEDMAAATRKIGLGAAIHQLIHAHGLESLNRTDGLDPLGAITQVIVPEEPLEFADGLPRLDGPNEAFAVGGELLFGAEDRWGD